MFLTVIIKICFKRLCLKLLKQINLFKTLCNPGLDGDPRSQVQSIADDDSFGTTLHNFYIINLSVTIRSSAFWTTHYYYYYVSYAANVCESYLHCCAVARRTTAGLVLWIILSSAHKLQQLSLRGRWRLAIFFLSS